MHATRIYTGDDGLTHFASLEVPLHSSGAIGRLSETFPAGGVIFRETDGRYDYDWHTAPARQWIVLLDGRIEIETGDGEIREFGSGDVLLVEDTEGRGHRTRQLNPGTRRSLFIRAA